MDYADLEIGLHRRGWDRDDYAVELRFTQPGNDSETGLGQRLQPVVRIDWEALREREGDELEYGRKLTANLFADPAFRQEFGRLRGIAEGLRTEQGERVPLRLRLFIGSNAAELQSLRWEVLVDPLDDTSLISTNENIIFSRYLSSPDARPLRLRAKSQLRALVAIANPPDLERFRLPPVKVAAELERARMALGDLPNTPLAQDDRVTLNNLMERLRTGYGYDILYLVCHGALVEGEPRLWLEDQDENGHTVPVSGNDLATRLKELLYPPRLIVLASCQSAGSGEQTASGEDGALVALGPRLAEAGVPAVVAMQGKISMKTVEQFMPVFFRELKRDGVIDRALAVARGEVRRQLDWWMPVLLMRLRSGRMWYVPGYGEAPNAMEKWPALLAHIRDGMCLPVLGPELTDGLIGSRWELAQKLAEHYHFPMATHDRDDLPQVTQFLAVRNNPSFVPRELMLSVCEEMIERRRQELPTDLQGIKLRELSRGDLVNTFLRLAELSWDQQRQANKHEPHAVLAKLPFSIYLTTNQDSLLAKALADAGKQPEVELCRWNDDLVRFTSIFDSDRPQYEPSVERPLVYHLFGRIEKPPLFAADPTDLLDLKSAVLTEDDYFDFLLGVNLKPASYDVVPVSVRRALADRALLFIGFQMDDWNFRVLLRYILSLPGGNRRGRYTHIAVQINPEEGRVQSLQGARRFLELYFQGAYISVYWGTVEDSIRELHYQWFGS